MGGQAENACQPALKGGVAILKRDVEISNLLQCLQSVYPNQKARDENGEEKGDNEWTEDATISKSDVRGPLKTFNKTTENSSFRQEPLSDFQNNK